MSGHNSNGRLDQSNWNQLHVSPYIPLPPQLPHMSNEQPLMQNPLAWHNPTTPNNLYYGSAIHKNPLDVNPLLPGINNSQFDVSVDLSISSRNNKTPSPTKHSSPNSLSQLNCIMPKKSPRTKDKDLLNGHTKDLKNNENIENDVTTPKKERSSGRRTSNSLSSGNEGSTKLSPNRHKKVSNSDDVDSTTNLVTTNQRRSENNGDAETETENKLTKRRRQRKPSRTTKLTSESDGNEISYQPTMTDELKDNISQSNNTNGISDPSYLNMNNFPKVEICQRSSISDNDVVKKLDSESCNGKISSSDQPVDHKNHSPNQSPSKSRRKSKLIERSISDDFKISVCDSSGQSFLDDSAENLQASIENAIRACEENVTPEKLSEQEKLDKSFDEVENNLEQIFAGIDGEGDQKMGTNNSKLTNDTETIASVMKPKSSEKIVKEKSVTKKSRKRLEYKELSKIGADESDDEDFVPPASGSAKRKVNGKDNGKNKKLKKSKPNQKKAKNKSDKQKDKVNAKVRDETSNESTSVTARLRGPFVHVGLDGTASVINASNPEDITEKKAKLKSLGFNSKSNNRNHIRSTFSTLSKKYDADTRDESWMCVFCKLGPHKFGLGDLFGPYFISSNGEDFNASQLNPASDSFKSNRTKANMVPSRPIGGLLVTPSKNHSNPSSLPTSSGKKKRKTSEMVVDNKSGSDNQLDIFTGMNSAPDNSYEIWVHEDCLAWAPGIHMIGLRIVGLDLAVWSATQYKCNVCLKNGAMLSCLERGCTNYAHFICAHRTNWSLEQSSFISYCEKHIKPQ